MRLQKLILIIVAILFTACKTQEDIRRDKTMENISEKISQTQQSTASNSARFQSLEEQMLKLNGAVEEMAHNKGQDSKEVLLLKERLNQLDEVNKKQSENIKLLADKVNEQSKYIEQVVKSLSDLAEKKEAEAKEAPKKKAEKVESEKDNSIKGALAKYKAHEYEDAKNTFESLLENSKLKKKDKSTAVYYLGLIQYKEKKYEDAKIYFSRVFTEFPDSTYCAPALLNLAKTFTQLKSKEEAKQTLDELISRFPKSKEAVEGAKLKTKI